MKDASGFCSQSVDFEMTFRQTLFKFNLSKLFPKLLFYIKTYNTIFARIHSEGRTSYMTLTIMVAFKKTPPPFLYHNPSKYLDITCGNKILAYYAVYLRMNLTRGKTFIFSMLRQKVILELKH